MTERNMLKYWEYCALSRNLILLILISLIRIISKHIEMTTSNNNNAKLHTFCVRFAHFITQNSLHPSPTPLK